MSRTTGDLSGQPGLATWGYECPLRVDFVGSPPLTPLPQWVGTFRIIARKHCLHRFATALKSAFRSQRVSAPPLSPQSRNLRVGPQFPLYIVTTGPEDDAGGTPGLELGETFTQLLASASEGHLFGGGHVDEQIVAV